MPMGEVIHTGTAVLDGSGVGDEAALRLQLPLPQNFGYALQTLVVQTIASVTNAWGGAQPPALEMFLADNEMVDQANTTQIDIPMGKTSLTLSGQPDTANGLLKVFYLGAGLVDSNADASAIWGQPYPMQYGYWESLSQTGTIPVFTVGNAATAIAAGTVRWYSRWLAYNLEQFSHAGLNWRIPTT